MRDVHNGDSLSSCYGKSVHNGDSLSSCSSRICAQRWQSLLPLPIPVSLLDNVTHRSHTVRPVHTPGPWPPGPS